MALSESQRTVLAAHIRANSDPDVVAALAARNDTAMTQLYNADSSVWVWRTYISPDEYREAIVWTEVDTLGAGNARIWEWITANMTLPLDASKANVRQGLADAFAQNTSTRGALLTIAKRLATLAESVFSTGTGTENNPGELVFQGVVTIDDIGKSLNENP